MTSRPPLQSGASRRGTSAPAPLSFRWRRHCHFLSLHNEACTVARSQSDEGLPGRGAVHQGRKLDRSGVRSDGVQRRRSRPPVDRICLVEKGLDRRKPTDQVRDVLPILRREQLTDSVGQPLGDRLKPT